MPHYYEREGSAEEQARVALQRAEAREARLDMEARRFSGAVDGLISMVETTTEQTDRLLARARASDAEVERLRQMILYALAGPDEDLPDPLGGRAVASVKKILRDALEGE